MTSNSFRLSENPKDNRRGEKSTASGNAEGTKTFNKTDSHADLADFCCVYSAKGVKFWTKCLHFTARRDIISVLKFFKCMRLIRYSIINGIKDRSAADAHF